MKPIAAAVLLAAAAVAAAGCASTDTPTPTPKPSPAGLRCTDVGGVFEAHGTDGRGSCVPADSRPECHRIDPADGNQVTELVLDPPRADGLLGAGARTMLELASNKDCWKLPTG